MFVLRRRLSPLFGFHVLPESQCVRLMIFTGIVVCELIQFMVLGS